MRQKFLAISVNEPFAHHLTSMLADSFETKTYRKISWRLIPLLLFCYTAAYLDRVNIGFAKLQMMSDLGMSDMVYGLGAGMFFIGYFLFEVPSNIILYKVGARLWIGRIMITWGILSAGMVFVTSEFQFYLMRFLLGVAEAGFFPGIILYLTYWYPSHHRGRITAFFMTAIPLAGIFGGPLSGWILKNWDHAYGWHGWQWMFLLEAIPSVALGLIVILFMNDRISQAHWLNDAERALLEGNIRHEEKQKIHMTFRHLAKSGRVWAMSAVYFSMTMSLYGISFWLPTIIKDMGITDNLKVGMLSAIPWLAAMIAMLFFAHRADLARERRWHITVAMFMGASGLIGSVLLAHSSALALFALTIACMGIMSAIPLFWSFPTALLLGSGAAMGIAAINSVANLAGLVSPYVFGWLKQITQSTDSGMYMLAIVLILGALITLKIPAAANE